LTIPNWISCLNKKYTFYVNNQTNKQTTKQKLKITTKQINKQSINTQIKILV